MRGWPKSEWYADLVCGSAFKRRAVCTAHQAVLNGDAEQWSLRDGNKESMEPYAAHVLPHTIGIWKHMGHNSERVVCIHGRTETVCGCVLDELITWAKRQKNIASRWDIARQEARYLWRAQLSQKTTPRQQAAGPFFEENFSYCRATGGKR